ncbi:MAG: D-2-hydroxyacid dehydrogenase [Chloroflexi bacterium]|nr:D-2-hydroxyacid dehydrogenase [Chloroflexota bacterium]
MKIVVLDGYTLNPGDLSWDALKAFGECDIYDRTPPELTVERAQGAEVVMTNKVLITREIIAALSKLRYIGSLATGYNQVDIEAARERNIPVTNIPEYGTRAVAQNTFAHLLNLTQHVAHHAQTVREGRWTKSVDFCYWDYPLIELVGLTMGIVGLGRIGCASARLAQAFGMTVLAYDPYVDPSPVEGVQMVDYQTLLRESDVVSFHVPLTAETEGMLDRDSLALMKKTAFVINTSRGPVVRNADLAEALEQGRIAGAGLDVLEVEPPPMSNPLIVAPNCYITPHISWAARSSRARLMNTVIENLRGFLEGKPVNVVN